MLRVLSGARLCLLRGRVNVDGVRHPVRGENERHGGDISKVGRGWSKK